MQNKTVIITGANGGLGTTVVEKFLSAGYNVVATVVSEKEIASLKSNENLKVFAVDLSNEEMAGAFVKNVIIEYKTIDAAVLLVGGFSAGNIEKTTGADLKKMLMLNFETAYNIARPVFNHMMEKNAGRLVMVGARPAVKATDGKNMIAYALSKSQVIKLAELLNAAAKGKNVTASIIIPSTIDTPANRSSMPNANPDDWVKPGQIAGLMEMICSDVGSPLRETVFKVYGNS